MKYPLDIAEATDSHHSDENKPSTKEESIMRGIKMILAMGILLAVAAPMVMAGSDSPKEVYAVYVIAQKAGDLEGMSVCVIEAKAKQLEAMPEDQKGQIAEMMKMMAPAEYAVVSEDIQGDNATLTVTGKTSDFSGGLRDQKGTITFLKEGGAWKLAAEKWK